MANINQIITNRSRIVYGYYDNIEKYLIAQFFSVSRMDTYRKKINDSKKELILRTKKINIMNKSWMNKEIPYIYNEAYNKASNRIENILKGKKSKNINHNKEIEQIIKNGMLYYMNANEKIIKSIDQYFEIINEAIKTVQKESKNMVSIVQLQNFAFQDYESDIQEIITDDLVPIRRITKAGYAYYAGKSEYETYKDVIGYLQSELGEVKIIPITAKTGKIINYNPKKYAKMVTRTEMRKAESNAILNSCRERDNDLIMFSEHANPCPICASYEGMIYSISGLDPIYPEISIEIPLHPNCEHTWVPTSREAIAE